MLFFVKRLALADLVEGAAVREVLFLRFGPAAKNIIDSKQLQFREGVFVFLRDGLIAWAVEVFAAISCPSGE